MKAISDVRGCTAAEEFERLLSRGSGPNAIYHLPARMLRVVDGAIADLGAQEVAARWHIAYRFVGPILAYSATRTDGANDEEMPGHVLALLHLRGILQSVRDRIGAETPAQRFEVFREVLRLFWLALAVPMVQSDGHSRAMARNSRHLRNLEGHGGNPATDAQQDRARELRKNGMPRPKAVATIASEYRVTAERARTVLRDAGWPGRKKPRTE